MSYSEEAFTRIMDLYGDTVLRICFVRLRSYADAQDAFQDVFLSLYRAKKPPEEAYLKPWLIRTACNRCVSLLRAKKPVMPLPEEIGATVTERNTAVTEAILSLPGPQRTAVYLFYYENMKTAEIASCTGQTDANVRVLLHRGREKLREILKEEYHEGF